MEFNENAIYNLANHIINEGLPAVCEFVRGEAVKRVHVDTGYLKGSIDWDIDGSEGTIFANTEYAAIEEFGGEIKAKEDGWLIFKTKDGQWHKVKSVTRQAHPYLRPALYENLDTITRIFASGR